LGKERLLALGYWPLAKGNGNNRNPMAKAKGNVKIQESKSQKPKAKSQKPKAKSQAFIADRHWIEQELLKRQ
jgi:hypothetical protein